ncbi:hypothetical protein [uncultured Chryseobacterium sp.]|uniref:hypothetical protein n=1 Tax=uncultured Chryseobacterium sp. TaxID=259322 RepID=UPI0025DC1DEC|nr:hypothetical protein [uncultured Chryseobacterium sp.]
MEAAQPLHKGSGNPHGPGKKQKPEKPVVVPLPVTEVANLQTQKPESTAVTAGSANPYSDRKNLNGTIAPVHGSKTIYGQGAEIRYGKFQESLAETGDLNHPDTKEAEKKYMAALSINETQEYQDRKSGTYLPKTLEEQAAAYQENKIQKEAQQKAKPAGSGNADDALTDLSHAPATELAAQFNAVQDSSSGLFNNKAEKAANRLPKVNAKSGSAFTGSKPKRKAGPAKKTAKPGKKALQPVAQKPKSKEVSFTQSEPLKKTSYSFNAAGKTGGLEKQAQHVLGNIQLDTSAIPAAMRQDTRLQLTGEADTQHLAIEQQEAAHDMGIQKDHAENDIHKDYGENDIIKKPKDEILKPSRKISAKAVKKQPLESLKLEGIDKAGINEQFAPVIRTKIGTENEKYKAAELEHDQKVLEQEKTAETQIGTEKDRSHEKQLKTVKDARSDVHSSRVEWQQALDQTEADFARKSGDHAKATLGHIKTEKSRGETTAQGHVDKANAEVRKKKEAAQAEARQKKTEQQKASGGFFGWVADKASEFINALKDALNYIFTKLRDAVKAIFEAAKTLVLAALELARKAIVSLIKAFASVIKGFLDIALAAFPGIRDRLKARIDKYVAVAEKLVNQAFEAFKKAVVAVIDFLADVVDNLLASLQAVYNLILDAVNFIVAGIIKIMKGLANLTASAMQMPDNFMGQISEEFLGMDITQPLPFEKTAMAETTGTDADFAYANLLGKSSYDESDFHVDSVTDDMELSPELLAQLQDSNGEINFGANENTIDTFKQSALGSEEPESRGDVAENQNIPADPYAQADWFINYQNSQSPPSTDTSRASGKQPATSGSMPENMKLVGPWTPGVRLYYLKEQMWSGIKKNWAENKWKYIGIGAAVVLGITALAILTAGAIFALIPPALEIFAAIMMAQAVAKASGFFKTFMTDGWIGDIASAGKALARAVGIILVELLFILLFDSAALFKVLKTAAKGGVKGVFNLAKTSVKSTLKAGKNALAATGKGFVKQAGKAKFFVQGIGKGIAKGAKNLDELGENLAKRFKFKGFSLELKGRWFTLYGIINPKIPLAKGKVENIAESETKDLLSKGKVVAKFTRGKEFEIIDKKRIKDIFGDSKIALKPDETIAITGVVKNVNVIKQLSKNGDNVWKTGINVGGMDILSSPAWFKIRDKYVHLLSDSNLYWKKVTSEFWETVNRPWIDDIIKRGDEVRFVSDPKSVDKLFVKIDNDFVIDELGNRIPTIFSKEIERLLENGYKIEGHIAKKIK